jgi:hypothetical protein
VFWEYNGDVGRRGNVDPVLKVWESPYLCFSGNPIVYADPDGLDSEDPKYKTLQDIVVVGKRPKEGAHRTNSKVLDISSRSKLKNTISDFLTATPGGIKPPAQIELPSLFQTYHRGGKYFDGGWYDDDVYKLTTFDWDNGQVMEERDWLDKLGTEAEFNDYTPVRGGLGGRDWNGLQVDDNGFLTDNLFSGPSVIKQGGNPIKTVRNASKFLNRLSKLMRYTKSRADVLNSVQNPKLKNILNDLIRKNKNPVGNGSAMDAFRFEKLTGSVVGGKRHALKILNYRTALVKVLKQQLNSSDRKIATEILKDITNALKGN